MGDSTNSELNIVHTSSESQPLIQPQNTYLGLFKSAVNQALNVYDTITTPQIPRYGEASTEETSPSSPTLLIPGAYPHEPCRTGRFSTAQVSEVPARTTQNFDEANIPKSKAGGLVIPREASHDAHQYGIPAPEDRSISHNQSPEIGVSSNQPTDHVSTQDFASHLQGAHHFTIDGSRFENIRVKNEYHYGNNGGAYAILKEFKEFVSFSAFHNSSAQDPTRRVHPGTRQYVLKRIRGWINTPSATERIFWLHGPAGVGKSAIAQTIARSCDQDTLAATFFFFRSDTSRNNGNRLFPTLAWQFAFSIPATKHALIHFLNGSPDIPMRDVETQFEELIVKPFLTLKASGVQLLPSLVIIDGVDECSDDGLQRRFLKIIGNAVRDNRIPLRFLICSRPEAHIQDVIDNFQSYTVPLDLAKLDDANQDIEKYFRAEFSRIAAEQDLGTSWPGEDIIQEFVYKASGQFIYASTVIKYVDDEYSSAQTQLDIIRGLKPRSTVSPFAQLDELYMEILRRQRDPDFLKNFLSLLIGRHGLNDVHLPLDDAMLMNVSMKELQRKLRGMRSVLKLEPYIDVHHRSFLEFLQDASRSGQYHISKQVGTRRYLDFIAGSLVRYVSSVIEKRDEHIDHFQPMYYAITYEYPGLIVLPIEEWQEALQPLLDIHNRLLTSANFTSTWELLSCHECMGFHAIRTLLLHLTFRLRASPAIYTSMGEPHIDRSEGMHSNVAPISTKIEMNMPETNLNSSLTSLLVRLQMRKIGTLLDVETIQLTCSLLRFCHAEIATRLRSISDAQNLVDLIDELINNKKYSSYFGPIISCKAVRLALEIYVRLPVLPQSLFLTGTVGPLHYVWSGPENNETESMFISKILDASYIIRTSWVYEEDNIIQFVCEDTIESQESLSQWRERSKPSSVTIIRIMLEVAKAILYFHSMGVVLSYHADSDLILLDSEFHAKFLFFGLTVDYVKTENPKMMLGPELQSYEMDIFFFGGLFYEMCFDTPIGHDDRLDTRARETVKKRPLKPEIPDDAWQLIQRCCAEDRESRPTMNDVVREMAAWDIS